MFPGETVGNTCGTARLPGRGCRQAPHVGRHRPGAAARPARRETGQGLPPGPARCATTRCRLDDAQQRQLGCGQAPHGVTKAGRLLPGMTHATSRELPQGLRALGTRHDALQAGGMLPGSARHDADGEIAAARPCFKQVGAGHSGQQRLASDAASPRQSLVRYRQAPRRKGAVSGLARLDTSRGVAFISPGGGASARPHWQAHGWPLGGTQAAQA